MPQPIAKLTNTGNFLINGTYGFDEATYDLTSGYQKNLFTYSQQFNNPAVWAASGVLQPAPLGVAPDGSNTAVLMSETADQNTTHWFYRNVSPEIPYATYTLSCYFKPVSGDRNFFLQILDAATGGAGGYSSVISNNNGTLNSYLGATGDFSNGSGTIVPVGNGWFRAIITQTLGRVSNNTVRIGLFNNGAQNYNGNGVSCMWIWGAQIEAGTQATDYEPTGATAFVAIPQGFTTRLDPTGFYTIGSFDEVSINPNTNSGTNLFQYSTDLTNTYWINYNDISVATNATTAPDGTNTAFLMTSIGTYPNNRPANNITVLPYNYYTLSSYVKYGNTAQCTIGNEGGLGSSAIASFDLTNGTNTSLAYNASNPIIKSVGNGWWRISVTIYTSNYNYIDPEPFRIGNYGGQNTGEYMYCWGPQLELGQVATDYVPTGTNAAPTAPFVERKSSTGLHRIAGAYDEASLNPASGYIKNYVSYSQNFSSIWSSGGGVYSNVLANVAMAPDGTMTASKLVETANNNYHVLYQAPNNNGIPGQVYCNSIYVKAAERYVFQMYAGGSSNWSTTPSGTFNLLTGTVLPGTFNLPAFITPVGNGWYRCSTQGICAYPPTGGLSLSTNFGTCLPGTTNVVYQGDGNSGIYIWGAQMELSTLNAGPSTYIATGLNGSPLT